MPPQAGSLATHKAPYGKRAGQRLFRMKRLVVLFDILCFLALALTACNNSVNDMLENYNGGVKKGYTTISHGQAEDEEILQPGDQGFDEKSMLRDEYFLGYDSTLNLYAPVTSERFEWYISDPDDEYETKIEFCPCNDPYNSQYIVTAVDTQIFSLYAEDSRLDNGTTYKLTLNVWKGGKKYSDECSLVVYQHYEWNQ